MANTGKKHRQRQTSSPEPLWMVTAAVNLDAACSWEGKPWQSDQCVRKTQTPLRQQRSVQWKLRLFQQSCTAERVGPWRRLSAQWLMLLNCGAGADSWVSRTVRRSNQSILKEVNSEYSLEGLLLKFQYFGHLMEEPTHFSKDAGKDWRQKERAEDEMVRSPPQWTWIWANSRS